MLLNRSSNRPMLVQQFSPRRWPTVLAIWLPATLVYLTLTCWIAARKLLWTDELFTYYIASVPTLSDMWQALATGADQHPPLFYLIVRGSLGLLGPSALAARLPGILAFWVMCLCLYAFVSRYACFASRLTAMLFPLVSGVYEMAFEARGYALVLGFSAFALLGWQRARDRGVRRWALLSVAVGVAGAVGSHYYAVLIVLPLAAAELWRSLERRRIDFGFVACLTLALAPTVLYLPFIRQAASFAAHFWAKPSPIVVLLYFNTFLGGAAATLLVAYVCVLGLLGCSRPAPAVDVEDGPAIPASERILVVVLLANQFAVLLLAVFLTNAFHFRYAILTTLGLGIALGFASHRVYLLAGRMRSIVLTGMITCFVVLGVYQIQVQEIRRRQLQATINWLTAHCPAELPIVLGDSEVWYQIRHYGDPALANRCHYLADPSRSTNYLKHDTVDRCGLALRPWFPHQMQPYDEFLQRHDQFLMYTGLNDQWCWLPSALLDDHCRLEWLERRDHHVLARVTCPAAGTEDAGAGRQPAAKRETGPGT